jgi:hypothetical protein
LKETGGLYRDAINSSASDTLKHNLEGTQAAKGLLDAGDPLKSSLGGQPNPMGEAIRSKYMGEYNRGAAQEQHTARMESKAQYFEKLTRVREAVGAEQDMNYEKMLAKYKADQARKAARAGLVGNVLGIVVGAVAGAYTGGAGAAAGYAAGNAAGTAIAGG